LSCDFSYTFIRSGFEFAVATLALFAVFVIVGSTAVSTVPGATGIVVIIVTRFVALPGWLPTRPFDFGDALVALGFVFTILAFAIFAVFELIALATGTTTISLVPATPGIVVFVVAEAITDEVF